jgi:hypothetical protein
MDTTAPLRADHIQFELKAKMNLSLNPESIPANLASTWRNLIQASPALALGGLVMLVWSLMTLLLPLFDARLFQGVSVWHKPWKFQMSTALYWLTLALFLSFVAKPSLSPAPRRYIVWMSMVAGLFEVGYITWQGALGLASHYNVSSPFYGYMYTAMGVGAVVLTSTSGVLGYHVLRSHHVLVNEAMRHAIGWGLLITSVLGIVTGAVLGGRVQTGGHWVGGTANDGLGMAIVNWSRDGGDLRVAHFFALHAMQILPVLALALCMLRPAMGQTAAKRWVWALSAGFSAFCVFTLLQALRGSPFFA